MEELDENLRGVMTENLSENELELEMQKEMEKKKAIELWESVCAYEKEITEYFATIYEREKLREQIERNRIREEKTPKERQKRIF